jgi:hypothetical protein
MPLAETEVPVEEPLLLSEVEVPLDFAGESQEDVDLPQPHVPVASLMVIVLIGMNKSSSSFLGSKFNASVLEISKLLMANGLL